MAAVRWCREAVVTDPSSRLPVLFRRSPRQAATVRPRLTSKTMWTMTKPKLCGLKGSTLMTPAVVAALHLVRWELSLTTANNLGRSGERMTR
jgi:hypothetical protein